MSTQVRRGVTFRPTASSEEWWPDRVANGICLAVGALVCSFGIFLGSLWLLASIVGFFMRLGG